jgi:acetyl-CoA carboxylase carboxyltransferase component
METIARGAAARGKKQVDETKLQTDVAKFSEEVKRDSEAYRTSAHLLDDGIIDPEDTRDVLGMCLEIVTIDSVMGSPGHHGLARL